MDALSSGRRGARRGVREGHGLPDRGRPELAAPRLLRRHAGADRRGRRPASPPPTRAWRTPRRDRRARGSSCCGLATSARSSGTASTSTPATSAPSWRSAPPWWCPVRARGVRHRTGAAERRLLDQRRRLARRRSCSPQVYLLDRPAGHARWWSTRCSRWPTARPAEAGRGDPSAGSRRSRPVFLAVVLAGGRGVGGFVLFVVPGIWLAVRWYFVPAGRGARRAPRHAARCDRSARAGGGIWWRVFGMLLAANLGCGDPRARWSSCRSSLRPRPPTAQVIHWWADRWPRAITAPSQALMLTLLYFDLRWPAAACRRPCRRCSAAAFAGAVERPLNARSPRQDASDLRFGPPLSS